MDRKNFTVAILVLALVLLSASLVLAGSGWKPLTQWNTAPADFSSTPALTCITAGGACQETFTWTAVRGAQGYILELAAHYQSGTGTTETSANCPDTVLKQTYEVPPSNCTGGTCTDTVDLLESVGLTGYTVISVDASVSVIIKQSWISASIPNAAASVVKESVNSCP